MCKASLEAVHSQGASQADSSACAELVACTLPLPVPWHACSMDVVVMSGAVMVATGAWLTAGTRACSCYAHQHACSSMVGVDHEIEI